MATQGQYVGESVIGTIGEDVGLGQVVYCKSSPLGSALTRGVWYPATADRAYSSSPDGPMWEGQNQLGIALQAATASPLTGTSSGTQISILLNGYYSPGILGFGGYCNGNLGNGAPVYLMPSGTFLGATDSIGCVDGFKPTYYGATQGVYRLIGYAYDIQSPYILKFDPDLTWIQI